MKFPSLASAAYTPGIPPQDAAQMQRFLFEEMQKISAAITALATGHLDKATAAPTKPRDGDLRIAATPWNPNSGEGLYVHLGGWKRVNPRTGTAVLAAGAATVAFPDVTASSRIVLTSQIDGGTVGFLRVSARAAGTSFTITSSSGTDASTVAFQVVEP